MKLKRGQLEPAVETLNKILQKMDDEKVVDTTLKYRIIRNITGITNTSEITDLKKVAPNGIEQEYHQKREARLNEICEKGEDGKPIFKIVKDEKTGKDVSKYVMDEETEKDFDKWLEDLTIEYNPKFQEAINSYNKIANEDVEIELKKLDLSSLSQLDLSSREISSIIDMIDEGEING